MTIDNKIDYWKKRLLDLGKRNKLINCSLPKGSQRVSRSIISIENPDANDIWELFLGVDMGVKIPYISVDEDKDSTEEKKEPVFEFPNGIRTNQTLANACKTLRNLMSKSKEFIENKGLNALYLAIGFIYWRENTGSKNEYRAPLLLIPISISQNSIKEPILITRLDDEVITNNALEQKLLNEYGIVMPEFDEDKGIDKYFSDVSDVCSSFNWRIEKEVNITLFSFLKMAMFHDVEENTEVIKANGIIKALNGDVEEFESVNSSEMLNYDHDSVEPRTVYSVVDADSSQQDAIMLAKQGVSFVLQGPPGTGKSQTITNIIAELLSQGKKVLFVSEKLAALDVVYKRLSAAGLSDFCLSLHNPNARRKEIMDQIAVSLKLSASKATLRQNAYDHLDQLKNDRANLNEYVNVLHTTIEPLGETIYRVNGYLSKLDNYIDIDYIQKGASSITSSELSKNISVIYDLSKIVEQSGYQEDNPWLGCTLTNISNLFRQKFLAESDELIENLKSAKPLFDKFRLITKSVVNSDSYNEGVAIKGFLRHLQNNSVSNPEWVTLDYVSANEMVEDCRKACCDKVSFDSFMARLVSVSDNLVSLINRLSSAVATTNITDLNAFILEYDSASKDINTEEFNSIWVSLSDISFYFSSEIRSFISNYEKLHQTEEKIDALEKDVELANQKLEDSRRTFDSLKTEHVSSYELLCQRYNESVLEINGENYFRKFSNDYVSGLRMFNSEYRKDKKTLASHLIGKKNLSYKQAMSDISVLSKVQSLKNQLDKQAEDVATSEKHAFLKSKELLESRNLSEDLKRFILLNQQKVIEHKNLFVNSIDSEKKNQENKQKDVTEIFDNKRVSLSKMIHVEITEHTDFEELLIKLKWLSIFIAQASRFNISVDNKKELLSIDEKSKKEIEELAASFEYWLSVNKELRQKFTDLFEDHYQIKINESDIYTFEEKIRLCRDNLFKLEYYIDYKNAVRKISEIGAEDFLNKAKSHNLSADEIVAVYKKCFYRSWLDEIIIKYDIINDFRGRKQNERIEEFRKLDSEHMEISRALLKVKLISELPELSSSINGGKEVTILKRELSKKLKLMPLRKLIASLPTLLPAIKPCILMSPLSVSTYFRGSNISFDTVIFDEASQVRTEDAICSILRAKQAIIAGDSKQLPPTSFFTSSSYDSDEYNDEDDDDTGAYESLLDEASVFPTQTLLWHYRSKNEKLIAFSNHKIYMSNLITFPSCYEGKENDGVEYVHVTNGIYERSGKRGNPIEAQKVADLVFEHFKSNPERSIGIIAFSEGQQSIIEDALDRKRKENPEFEPFFAASKTEPVFIRNLETVQGDERDTIIFSIGYGFDETGKFLMNFGPLSKAGGERRLNVAITRARYNLKLVGSILPTDIREDSISGLGPKLLRMYIDYAINGDRVILGENTSSDVAIFDSPFEESVYTFLVSQGYNVATQVGCSGYRIDLAVRDPEDNGKFAIAIECDGASYHSARTARERDRLRQTILEGMGWKFYRIWSTDWIKDPVSEKEKLLNAIEITIKEEIIDSIDGKCESVNEDCSEEFIELSEYSDNQKLLRLRSRFAGNESKDIPISDYATTMLNFIKEGFSYDKATLFKEVMKYGYLWKQTGPTINRKFNEAFDLLIDNKMVYEAEDGTIVLSLERYKN